MNKSDFKIIPRSPVESDTDWLTNNREVACWVLENFDRLVDEREAEILMAKAFGNIIDHMTKLSKEINTEVFRLDGLLRTAKRDGETPQQIQERRRLINILTGRAQGLENVAIPVISTACIMILEPNAEKAPAPVDPLIVIPE